MDLGAQFFERPCRHAASSKICRWRQTSHKARGDARAFRGSAITIIPVSDSEPERLNRLDSIRERHVRPRQPDGTAVGGQQKDLTVTFKCSIEYKHMATDRTHRLFKDSLY